MKHRPEKTDLPSDRIERPQSDPRRMFRKLLRSLGFSVEEDEPSLTLPVHPDARVHADAEHPQLRASDEPQADYDPAPKPTASPSCRWCGTCTAHTGTCPMESDDIPVYAIDDPSTIGAPVPDVLEVMPPRLQESLNLWMSSQLASIPGEAAFTRALNALPARADGSDSLSRIVEELRVLEEAGVTPTSTALEEAGPSERQAVLQALGYVAKIAKTRLITERLYDRDLPDTGDALEDALSMIRLYRKRFIDEFHGMPVASTLVM